LIDHGLVPCGVVCAKASSASQRFLSCFSPYMK
jgi:hypothetical protein